MRLSALDRADAIHVLFPTFKTWFPDHLQDRIVAIPNYIPEGFFADDPQHIARKQIVLGVGRLIDVKNYSALIAAWALVGIERTGWALRICGAGPDRQRLEQQIQKLGLSDSVLLAGQTDNVLREYREASIFCHPTKFEGFGLSVVEALACGTPVVAFDGTPGIEEYLLDGENAVLASREQNPSKNLADALKKLMTNADLRDQVGAKCPDSIRRFSIEEYETRWNSLIEDLTKNAS